MLRHNMYAAMTKAGIKASDLARLSGTSRAYVSLVLNGRRNNPSLDVLRRWAQVLGCDVRDLVA